jgi:hypothetical protein
MSDANLFRLRQICAALRSRFKYNRHEPWDLTEGEFIAHLDAHAITNAVLRANTSTVFYRIDTTKPWSASNLGYDAKLAAPRTTKQMRKGMSKATASAYARKGKRPVADPGTVILTTDEWIDQLRQNEGLNPAV